MTAAIAESALNVQNSAQNSSQSSTDRNVGAVGTAGTENTENTENTEFHPLRQTLAPLAIDIAVPLGGYYLLHAGFGVGTAAALAISSVVPAIRTVVGFAGKREANSLAGLMLAVNLAAIALTFVSGSARLMIAKDSAVSSVIAAGILWSARGGKPMMSAGLKPFVTKGDGRRVAAWDALKADSAAFRKKETLYSVIWGVALLAECVARLVGAFTLPVSTMAWLGTVLLLAAIGLACVLGGAAVDPIDKLIAARIAEEGNGAGLAATASDTFSDTAATTAR